jgi:predicted Zn-dependent protease
MINCPQFSKFLLLMPLLLLGCDKVRDTLSTANDAESGVVFTVCDPKDYKLDCMKDEKTATSDNLLDVLGGMKDAVVTATADPISDARQDEYGEHSRTEIEKEFQVIQGHPEHEMLQGILRKLLQQRVHPSDIRYNIYVIRSEMVNAFTVGGEIYVTNSLLSSAESKDEIACVIGHEIGHNELGHIAKKLKEVELAQGILGEETGAAVANFIGLLTIGFNQRSEAESDLYGIDLALSAGYDACRGIDFWKRMAHLEGEANDVDNFTRSHPYSTRRANCYRTHIADYHKYTCAN